MARTDPTTAYHAYGDNDAVPPAARLADHVSVARCRCGRVCLRFHTPATYTHGGRVFAVAYLDRKDVANLFYRFATCSYVALETPWRRSYQRHVNILKMALVA